MTEAHWALLAVSLVTAAAAVYYWRRKPPADPTRPATQKDFDDHCQLAPEAWKWKTLHQRPTLLRMMERYARFLEDRLTGDGALKLDEPIKVPTQVKSGLTIPEDKFDAEPSGQNGTRSPIVEAAGSVV